MNSVGDEIRRAIEVVGANPRGNRSLNAGPAGQTHIDALVARGEVAAPLVRTLRRPAVQAAFLDYQTNTRTAKQAQRRYKRLSLVLLLPLLLAVCVGMFGLVTTSSFLEGWLRVGGFNDRQVEIVARLGPLGIVTTMLFLTPILALTLRPQRFYDRWMTARARAEAVRRQLFERVIAAPVDRLTENELPPLLLKLEYFRRYQLELQSAFHQTRGKEHERTARIVRGLIGVANALLLTWGLVSVGACMAGRTEQGVLLSSEFLANALVRATAPLQSIEIWDLDYLVFAGSVILAATYAIAWLYALFSGSVRNAARYATMRENFQLLGEEISSVRNMALQGDASAITAFVNRVHSVMSAELADWVRLQDLDRGNDGPQSRLS